MIENGIGEKEGEKDECKRGNNDEGKRCEERDVRSSYSREGDGEEVNKYCRSVVERHLFKTEG